MNRHPNHYTSSSVHVYHGLKQGRSEAHQSRSKGGTAECTTLTGRQRRKVVMHERKGWTWGGKRTRAKLARGSHKRQQQLTRKTIGSSYYAAYKISSFFPRNAKQELISQQNHDRHPHLELTEILKGWKRECRYGENINTAESRTFSESSWQSHRKAMSADIR